MSQKKSPRQLIFYHGQNELMSKQPDFTPDLELVTQTTAKKNLHTTSRSLSHQTGFCLWYGKNDRLVLYLNIANIIYIIWAPQIQ